MKKTSLLFMSLLLSGCALLSAGLQAPEVSLRALRPLPAEGLEQRFELVLGISNPNDRALKLDGVDLELELNGKRLLRAMTNQSVSVGRLEQGEITVTGTVSMLDVLRQGLALPNTKNFDYRLHGRLFLANSPGYLPFTKSGSVDPEELLK